MERHFLCTACGKCCYGWLPLTLSDALAHVARFPLAVVWTPVRQASKAFDITAQLGLTVRTRDRKRLAVRIMPTACIPPVMPCPALTADNLCGIHEHKPSRCRTMPLFPYVDEAQQAEQLLPRPGWACDTSVAAPVVYRNRTVVDRRDFDTERQALLDQAPVLRAYGEWLMAMVPGMIDNLSRAALKPGGGYVVMSFATLLRRLGDVDKEAVAQAQIAILRDYGAKVAADSALTDYGRNYQDWLSEMERLAE